MEFAETALTRRVKDTITLDGCSSYVFHLSNYIIVEYHHPAYINTSGFSTPRLDMVASGLSSRINDLLNRFFHRRGCCRGALEDLLDGG